MRQRTPAISIVVPAYNAAATIIRTLESAAASLRYCIEEQGLLVEAEIVVVDDGSTDETASLVKKWSKRALVRLIRNGANRGAGFSRNEGVRQSGGGLLFFLDADDVFYPAHIH